MPSELFDITRTLSPTLAVWPGDTPFSAQVVSRVSQGEVSNLTTLTLSSHTGTHADAPYHVKDDGLTMAKVSLAAYIGPATVATVRRRAGPLTLADFPGFNWAGVQRLLVHSEASAWPADRFLSEYVYPSPELVDFLAEQGVILFGSDAPSVDPVDSAALPGHHALIGHGIAILENLYLTGVPDGRYELVALPLKIEGGDGSPIRAILRTL